MVCCVVYGCSNNSNKNGNGVSFYSFPAVRRREGKEAEELSRRRRNLWIARVNRRNFQPSPYSKVCSRHFVTGKPAYGMLEAHPDWAPSLHLGQDEINAPDPRKPTRKKLAETHSPQTAQGDTGAAEGKPGHGTLEAHSDWTPSLPFGHDEIHTTHTEGLAHQSNNNTLRKPAKKRKTAETDRAQIAQGDTGDTWAAEGQPAYARLETDTDRAPSLQMGHREIKAAKMKRVAHQLKRKHARKPAKKKSVEMESAPVEQGDPGDTWAAEGGASNNSQPTVKTECEPCAEVNHVLIKTEAEERPGCEFCECMRAEVNRLLEENRELRRELDERTMSEEFLKGDDVKVMYYTGLTSFVVLLDVLSHILPSLSQMNKTLSPFQMLVLTLMRLRLDPPIQLVADLFHVDLKTVSTTFVDTIDVLYTRLGHLIDWPERPCLLATMPLKFVEAFGDRAAIILDCLDVGIEGPSNQKARAPPFSHEQRSRTVKYLIAITPAGAVSFVSKEFCGCDSDKHVAENSGLLEKLLPRDLVLADHGFDIEDSVGMMCAEVTDPVFSEGQRQLDIKGVEDVRRIAHLRVHLEKLKDGLRDKYAMLNGTVPNSLVRPCEGEKITLLDKIVTVCCALNNIFPSVVVQYDGGHGE
ncbi:hypothetical protein NFI96_003389 [Prochilodus magdalenae]|nr:hypothetical protein NFI96_003389 [Prochilodus magdalenae]